MKLHVELIQRGDLTKRESDVLMLLCKGQLRKQIAGTLHRSYGTVSKQIEAIAQKLNAHSAAEIVAKAVASHLVNITIKIWLVVTLCTCCLDGVINTDSRRPPRSPRPPVTRCHTKATQPRFQREA